MAGHENVGECHQTGQEIVGDDSNPCRRRARTVPIARTAIRLRRLKYGLAPQQLRRRPVFVVVEVSQFQPHEVMFTEFERFF
jgi:hypothetical protein